MLTSQIVLSLSAISFSSTFASPTTSKRATSYAVREQHHVPPTWQKIGPASKRDVLQLSIGLKQQNEGHIEEHLLQVSDPKHERFGKHLSPEKIRKIVAPADETMEFVQAWLEEHGVSDYAYSHANDMIHCTVPVEKAEELLQTEYYTFRHDDGTTANRAPEWSLPAHLHEHIDFVQPTTSFFRLRKQVKPDKSPWESADYWAKEDKPGVYSVSGHGGSKGTTASGGFGSSGGGIESIEGSMSSHVNLKRSSTVQSAGHSGTQAMDTSSEDISRLCNTKFTTPQCIRTLYGTINYRPRAPTKNAIATCNYLNQTAHRGDIQGFMQTFRPDAVSTTRSFEYITIAGGMNRQGRYTPNVIADRTNEEADLDAQQAISITYPTKFLTYSTGSSPPHHASSSTTGSDNEPYLIWLDYILGHSNPPQVISTSYGDDEQSVPYSYAKRVCSGFAQLGVRGISVIFSSGDNGVGAKENCISNDGRKRPKFLGIFPGGCPWVTTVGATENFQPETAVTWYASGGGFSEYFPTPAYQKSIVAAYVKSLGGKHRSMYNANGRAYPDVAAQGSHMAYMWNNNMSTIGGTSAAAPIFASVISLVNDALIAAGKPSLGFLNPWLYSEGYKAMNDIVNGSSFGCGTDGFPAQRGWDAVTGWGTPNFQKLVDSAMRNGK